MRCSRVSINISIPALSRRKPSGDGDRGDERGGRPEIPVAESDPAVGLSEAEVKARRDAGWVNTPIDPPGKTVGQIIKTNVFTYFNLLFFFLALCVLLAGGSWQNGLFMWVIVANTAIGIIQELKSKKTLDRLALITAPKGTAVRGGALRELPTADMVRDDIVVFSAGSQIFADALVVFGECSANEALITGEADEIRKTVGSELLSGSFVVSGECRARLTAVGADSYVSKLTIAAKKQAPPKQSEMMLSLTRLVQVIGIMIIPLGVLMAFKEISWLGRGVTDGVVATVASLIGMIPEGLYLLTSMALASAVVRLAQKRTLVHDMGCIETLARVDVLCVDKTGTVTENKMTVDGITPLCPDRFIEDDIKLIMNDYVSSMKADNDTMAALRRYFDGEPQQTAVKTLPFSSSKKYGGVSFHEDETYLLGAPDVLLGSRYADYAEIIDGYAEKGYRTLLLCLYGGSLDDDRPDAELLPLAVIRLSNRIRPEAPDTFKYFKKQGVGIKVISGDNALAVSEVSRRAGVEGAENFIDARSLDTDEKIAEAVEKYTVFGRVTPEQKRKFVRALKAGGHTVAMTGDGVNDVLALKEADCSVAMASGSDAASQISHIVLLDSDFSAMPHVVAEGRRVINNIERSATLFIVKNIFAFTLAVISLIFTLPYPVTAAQMSLVNSLTIGIPGFVLAMEPNNRRITGRFLPNVVYRAFPGGITNVIMCMGVILFCTAFHVDYDMMSTICTLLLAAVGLFIVYRCCLPFNFLRRSLVVLLTVSVVFSALFLKNLFTLSALDGPSLMIFAVFALLVWPVLKVLTLFEDKVREKYREMKAKSREAA